MKKTFITLVAAVFMANAAVAADKIVSLVSPDGNITLTATLVESTGKLTYSVARGSTLVISPSELGIQTSASNFTTGLTYVSDNTSEINETYTLPSGKTKNYRNHCKELTLTVEISGKQMQIIFRAYNEGIAYRYAIAGTGTPTVTAEISEVKVADFQTSWAMTYNTPYERHFTARDWSATASVENNEFCAPVLVKTASNNYLLITEAANFGTYCTSKIKSGAAAETGRFYYSKVGTVRLTLPAQTPWRTVFIGTLGQFVESSLTENLNPPTRQTDISWIEAGVAAWDWAENDGGHSTNGFPTPKQFIDLAYKMGWKYFLLDDGWEAGGYPLELVSRYAKARNIKPLIWSHHNRFQNDSAQIRGMLEDWKNLGFAGAKIDFWEDDAQSMMQKYDKVLSIAGELHLLIDLHGCTKPSGTRRTYPHLITSEGVYGGEQHFAGQLTTAHHVTLALTRNVIGSMDYTPMEIAGKNGKIRQLTTWSQQLALTVLYESGLQCIFEQPQNILYNPHIREFLKVLPAAWDEVKCLDAVVDSRVTIARRSGEDWYVAAIANNSSIANIPLNFLGEGNYTAQIFKDGTARYDIALETQTVTNATTLHIPIMEQGGATIRISRTPLDISAIDVYEAENATLAGGAQIDNDNEKGLASGHKFVGFLGNGAKVTFSNINVATAGKYDLTIVVVSAEERQMYVKVNNAAKTLYTFASGGSWQSDGLLQKTVQVELQAGTNTIEFGNDNGWCPNLDRISISPAQTYTEPAGNGGEEPSGKIKVACIGNSITQGVGTPTRGFGYPFVLQDFIGDNYEVRNFGVSGFCMLKQVDNSYWNTSEYQYALLWNPDIVVIKLGTNDTEPYRWTPHGSEFKSDYLDMVNSFKNLPSHPTVYVAKPVPIYPTNSDKANLLINGVFPVIEQVATETGATLLDLYTPFVGRQDLFADNLHPNIQGMRWLAYQVGKNIQNTVQINESLVYASALPHALSDEKIAVSTSVADLDIAAMFDKNVATAVTAPYTADMSFELELPTSSRLTAYSITLSDEGTKTNRQMSWVLEGKNSATATTWTRLDTRNNITFLPNETKWVELNTSAKFFRLVIKNNGGKANVAIREWQMFGSRTPTTMETSVTNNGGTTTGQYVGYPNETIEKLTDKTANTKYCVVNKGTTFWAQYVSPQPVVIDRYKLTSANDISERDPMAWELQASNDGENWVTLDAQDHQHFVSRFSTLEYKFGNSTAYTHYRLQINKLLQDKATTFQLAEWQMFEKAQSSVKNVGEVKCKVFSTSGHISIETEEPIAYAIFNLMGQRLAVGNLKSGAQTFDVINNNVYLVAIQSNTENTVVKVIC